MTFEISDVAYENMDVRTAEGLRTSETRKTKSVDLGQFFEDVQETENEQTM
jgi:hypothetical protein